MGAFTLDPAIGAGAALAQWDNTPLENIRLSTLERVYKHKQADSALRLLNRKIRIKIDSHYILPTRNSIFRSTSYLDFFAAIPREPGLSVILPPQNSSPDSCWNFMLDFCYPHHPFHYKHGKLGFRPDRAACYIGSTDSVDIWVLFVHEDKLEDDSNTLPAGSSFTNPTQLSAKHFCQFLSWMLYCLSSIAYPGLHLRSSRRYAVNLDHNSPNWSFVPDFRNVLSPPFQFQTNQTIDFCHL